MCLFSCTPNVIILNLKEEGENLGRIYLSIRGKIIDASEMSH